MCRDSKTRVYNKKPNNLQEFCICLQEQWQTFPNETILNLYSSIPRRVKVVIYDFGSHTDYTF